MATLKIWDGSAWVEVKGAQGEQGTPGTPGTAATVTVSGTTTGAAGTNATVAQGGTSTARTLSFTIPRGDKGDKGDKGDTGNTGSTGPNPMHRGTTAPANPTVQGIWIDTSS